MKRVLVTGGAGYIGSHVIFELLQSSAQIVVLDNFSNTSIQNVRCLQDRYAEKIRLVEGDICDSNILRNIFENLEPETVIHLAGHKCMNESIRQPLLYYENNVGGSLALIKAMEKYGTKKILFSSSASIYGNVLKKSLSEEDICNPMHAYAWSKYFVEQIIKDWVSANSNSSAVILRYFNPVGAHSSAGIGESLESKYRSGMTVFMECALGKTEKVFVFGDDHETVDGASVRDYLHIEDLAKAHIKALDFMELNNGVEIINVGTGLGVSAFELIKSLENASNRKIPFEIRGRRHGDISYSVANPLKAEKLLGWRAQKTLGQMCTDAWGWFNDGNKNLR